MFSKINISNKVKTHKVLLENMTYITMLQIFLLIAPLITYPYLIRVFGRELYGMIITANVLVSYATIIINFGTDRVCAKHVSINRDDAEKLSEIVCSVLGARTILAIGCFILYMGIVFIVPSYRPYMILFLLSYGHTFHEWIFPQYFFQGIEKMKYTTLISIVIKCGFIALIFFVVKSPDDYLWVPALYSIGYFVGGAVSLYIIFEKMHIKFVMPHFDKMLYYLKDSSAIFATEIIRTIKDKFNYFILGSVNLSDVVIYDFGYKLASILSKPSAIFSTALFPKSAQNKGVKNFNKALIIIFLGTLLLVLLTNLVLPWIVQFFIPNCEDLMPIRVFLIAPIFLSVSSFISSNLFVARGFNKYVLYSIIVTTIGYLLILGYMYITRSLNSAFSFVIIAVATYFVELVYRLIKYKKIVSSR